jgi:hypothetical protein
LSAPEEEDDDDDADVAIGEASVAVAAAAAVVGDETAVVASEAMSDGFMVRGGSRCGWHGGKPSGLWWD